MSQALEEKTKAELAKLQSDTAAPSSFVEEGAPDSFADLDAKLKAPSQLMLLEQLEVSDALGSVRVLRSHHRVVAVLGSFAFVFFCFMIRSKVLNSATGA